MPGWIGADASTAWSHVATWPARVQAQPEAAAGSAGCTPAGKVVVGTGYNISGGKFGSHPNEQTNVVVNTLLPASTFVAVEAYEEEATSASWHVTAYAMCATAP